MKKDDFIKNVTNAGDAIITYRSQNSRRMKYNVCTMDFDNKHIQTKRNRAKNKMNLNRIVRLNPPVKWKK